jgi:hypothetical protein
LKALYVSENKNDQETLERVMANLFKDLELISVSTKEEAINIVASDGPFGMFIIDVELKKIEPEDISNLLIEIAGERPFIFLGHDAIISDRISQDLFQSNSYNDKLLKPLDRNDIVDDIKMKVSSTLEWAKEEEFESSIEEINSDDFISMKIKSFYLFNSFPYDIYLEVTSTQYIKILSANKNYSISTLAAYAKKNVKVLYIKKDEHLRYLEEESLKCLKAIKKISPNSNDVFIVLLKSITVFHQYMLALGLNPTILSLANGITDLTINVSEHYRGLKDLFKQYPDLYEGISSKSLLTALIANRICKSMGWDSITTKKKLAMSALLHDYNLPEDSLTHINYISDPRIQNYSDKKVEEFHNHPLLVAEVARQFTVFPDIDYIIEHHHELPQKKGFPAQSPLTKLTAICGVFNTAQYLAAELDGKRLNAVLIQKIMRSMNRDFNAGNFKEPYIIIKKLFSSK